MPEGISFFRSVFPENPSNRLQSVFSCIQFVFVKIVLLIQCVQVLYYFFKFIEKGFAFFCRAVECRIFIAKIPEFFCSALEVVQCVRPVSAITGQRTDQVDFLMNAGRFVQT